MQRLLFFDLSVSISLPRSPRAGRGAAGAGGRRRAARRRPARVMARVWPRPPRAERSPRGLRAPLPQRYNKIFIYIIILTHTTCGDLERETCVMVCDVCDARG